MTIMVTVWLAVLFSLNSSLGSIAKKTKLCGDEACSEKLFEGKFHRSSLASHESFLSPNENDVVSVYAIKFSDRTDLMEGALVREPSRKGNFFSMHINLDDYVEFLKKAVVSNKTMFMVSRDPHDHPSHRLVGIKAALPELIKDYEVNAKRLSIERQLSTEQIDYAALGYFSDTEGNEHSNSYEQGHSFDHGLPQEHGHYYGHGVHTDSHERIRIVQHTRHSTVLSSEAEAISPLPVVNVAANEPQQTNSETVTSVHQQKISRLESEFKVMPGISAQQNLMYGSASRMSPPDARPISEVIPDVPEVMVPGIPSAAEETTSGNLPSPATNSINFAAKNNLPEIELPQEKTPQAANVNAQNLLRSQPVHPVSMQHVNIDLPHQRVITTPSSVDVLESNLGLTSDNTSEMKFSLSSVNVSLPNISSKTVDSSSISPSPSVTTISDGTSPIPVNNRHSNSFSISSAPSSPLEKHHTTESAPFPSDSAGILTGDNVSAFPHTEPTAAIFAAPQLNPATALSEFGSAVKMEPESEEKDVETTTVDHNLPEPPPFQSLSRIPSKDSTSFNDASASVVESISRKEQETQSNPKARTDIEGGNADGSVQTEGEVKANTVDNGLDYCMKSECDDAYSTRKDDEKLDAEYFFVIRRWLSKFIGIARYMLPTSINNIDDAGVLVTVFVPVCLFIHLLRTLIFADTFDKDNFDRKILHNALTTIREREAQIMLLHAEMEKRKNAWNTEADEQLKNLQLEMSQLKTKCHMLEKEHDNLKAELDDASQMVEKERLKCTDLIEQNRNLGEKNELLTKQSCEIHGTVDTLREENKRLVSEVAKKSAQLIRLESDANSHSLEVNNLKDQLKTSLSESRILQQRVEELQNEIVQLSEIINEIHHSRNVTAGDRSSAAEADNGEQVQDDINGESGWSDFGEFDVDDQSKAEVPERQKKDHVAATRISSTEIIEVAKLRVQLKTVESDLDLAKLALQKQLNQRDHLMRKVEFAEAEAAKRLKEVEAKEAERIEAQNQFKKILGMIEEREAKLRSTEELTETIRNELMKWQKEVRRLEDQKKAVEFKLLETDQELKRLKSEYAKLETRNFHEIRQCKQTIAALQQQQSLEQAHMSIPPSNLLDNANVLNISASSSSDRDYGISLNNDLAAPPLLPHVRPLWDDESPEIFLSRGESSLLKKVDPQLNDVVQENGNVSQSRGLKQRRSVREREHNIDVGNLQSRHKKEARRMRSRSHGRRPFHPDYLPTWCIPGYSMPAVLSKQNSKSGTLHYSSGGSNDGRSPPPEMALLSGVPPPGPMIKKPMPRPKSSIEPLERR